MKNLKRNALAGALFVASATAALAATVNAVTNGDFETGTLAGWVLSCPASGNVTAGVLGAGDLPINSGSNYAFVNTENQASTTCDLYQDVAIPANATAASLTMRYALTGSNGINATESRQIDITTPANVVLINVQASVNRGVTRAFAPLAAPVDLSAFAGQTVRIRARASNTTTNSTSANIIALDDVVLSVTTPDPIPTLSEWTMIILGLMMAGGAALVLQRRQALA